MIVFIKTNEIVTEYEYTQEQTIELVNKNFSPVEVPDGVYDYKDFEFKNNEWKLKEKEII